MFHLNDGKLFEERKWNLSNELGKASVEEGNWVMMIVGLMTVWTKIDLQLALSYGSLVRMERMSMIVLVDGIILRGLGMKLTDDDGSLHVSLELLNLKNLVLKRRMPRNEFVLMGQILNVMIS